MTSPWTGKYKYTAVQSIERKIKYLKEECQAPMIFFHSLLFQWNDVTLNSFNVKCLILLVYFVLYATRFK